MIKGDVKMGNTVNKDGIKKISDIAAKLLEGIGCRVDISFDDDKFKVKAFDDKGNAITTSDQAMRDGNDLVYWSSFTVKDGIHVCVCSTGVTEVDFNERIAIATYYEKGYKYLRICEYDSKRNIYEKAVQGKPIPMNDISIGIYDSFAILISVRRLLQDGEQIVESDTYIVHNYVIKSDGTQKQISINADKYIETITDAILNWNGYYSIHDIKKVIDFILPTLRLCANTVIEKNTALTNDQKSGGKK